MEDKTKIILTAIISTAILCGIAMFKGIDGAVYMTALTIIGGVAGYELKTAKNYYNQNK